MHFAPTFLCTPCPWCGVRNLAPVATPIRELEPLLESRCSGCHGGVRARTSWETFACFSLAYALVSDLTVYLAVEGHLRLGGAWNLIGLGAWICAVIAATAALSRFLVANSAMRRGREPRR